MLAPDNRDLPPFVGIDHVAIAVEDIDTALPAYSRLGLVLIHRETLPETGTELAYLDGHNVQVQLAAPIGAGLVRDHLDSNGEGLHHLCFAVEEIPRALDEMTDGDDPKIFMGGRNRRACFLTQKPSHVLVELTETHSRTLSGELIEAPEETQEAR